MFFIRIVLYLFMLSIVESINIYRFKGTLLDIIFLVFSSTILLTGVIISAMALFEDAKNGR